MLTCREAEKMVMPYIEGRLDEQELEAFLNHVSGCASCREELEIYFTVSEGLRQLDSGTGVYDIPGALSESLDIAWMKVRAVRLRRIISYAVTTLGTVSLLVMLIMQLRIWVQGGLFG
ncbi:MAG: zf-HC2 domain-containing protein [Eubacteriales bacterium]|nr:zf-HC2 domain-containing protein [Eubacteriales bacterium]